MAQRPLACCCACRNGRTSLFKSIKAGYKLSAPGSPRYIYTSSPAFSDKASKQQELYATLEDFQTGQNVRPPSLRPNANGAPARQVDRTGQRNWMEEAEPPPQQANHRANPGQQNDRLRALIDRKLEYYNLLQEESRLAHERAQEEKLKEQHKIAVQNAADEALELRREQSKVKSTHVPAEDVIGTSVTDSNRFSGTDDVSQLTAKPQAAPSATPTSCEPSQAIGQNIGTELLDAADAPGQVSKSRRTRRKGTRRTKRISTLDGFSQAFEDRRVE